MKMSRGELLAYVAAHPNTTSDDLARAFGISLTDAAGRLSRAYTRGNLCREVMHYLPRGNAVYGYRVVEGKPEPMLKSRQPEQKAAKIAPSTFDLSGGIAVLAENIAKQIASQVVHALQGQLTRELAGVVPPVISAPPVTISQPLKVETPKIEAPVVLDPPVIEVLKHQRLPKVAIIGVTPQQAGILSTEFSDTYDLSFWQNDGIPRLRSIGVSCELCLVTKFVSHKATEVLTAQGAHWRKVTGGIDSIRDALTGYYVERT
ncbi:MAG TPA: hypothetical protein PKK30_09635 [Nitrospira sp.]|nr:hypothetical protein [Nitrospira sp.]